MSRLTLVGFAVTLAVGILMGAKSAPEPPPEFIKVPQTKVIEAEPEIIEKTVVPVACIEANAWAQRMAQAAEDLRQHGTVQLRILSNARMAIAGGDDLNKIENSQRDLNSKQSKAVLDLAEAEVSHEAFQEKCEEQQ